MCVPGYLNQLLRTAFFAVVQLKNGQKRKEEFYYGSSFLSQSGRFIELNPSVGSVEITNTKKEKRLINN